jgi:hypothetical protein
MGDGSVWGSAIAGTIIETITYQWVDGAPAAGPFIYGTDAQGNANYAFTVGAGYWTPSSVSFSSVGPDPSTSNVGTSGGVANNGPGFLRKLNTCVVNNAKNYSIGGAANLTFNTQIPGSSLAGNDIADTYLLLTGQEESLLSSIWSGGKLGFDRSASSAIMTNGPNSLTTISPVRGSPQPVLGSGANYSVSFLGKLAKAGKELKLAVDAGLTGALVLNCSLGQVH